MHDLRETGSSLGSDRKGCRVRLARRSRARSARFDDDEPQRRRRGRRRAHPRRRRAAAATRAAPRRRGRRLRGVLGRAATDSSPKVARRGRRRRGLTDVRRPRPTRSESTPRPSPATDADASRRRPRRRRPSRGDVRRRPPTRAARCAFRTGPSRPRARCRRGHRASDPTTPPTTTSTRWTSAAGRRPGTGPRPATGPRATSPTPSCSRTTRWRSARCAIATCPTTTTTTRRSTAEVAARRRGRATAAAGRRRRTRPRRARLEGEEPPRPRPGARPAGRPHRPGPHRGRASPSSRSSCFLLGRARPRSWSAVIVGVAAFELYEAFRRAGYHPATLLGLLGCVAIVPHRVHAGHRRVPAGHRPRRRVHDALVPGRGRQGAPDRQHRDHAVRVRLRRRASARSPGCCSRPRRRRPHPRRRDLRGRLRHRRLLRRLAVRPQPHVARRLAEQDRGGPGRRDGRRRSCSA